YVPFALKSAMPAAPLLPNPGSGAAAAPATPRAKVAETTSPPAAVLSANFGGLTNFLRACCDWRPHRNGCCDRSPREIRAERGPVAVESRPRTRRRQSPPRIVFIPPKG